MGFLDSLHMEGIYNTKIIHYLGEPEQAPHWHDCIVLCMFAFLPACLLSHGWQIVEFGIKGPYMKKLDCSYQYTVETPMLADSM